MSQPKELKEILSFIIELAKTSEKVLADGKIGMDDLGPILRLLPKLAPGLIGAEKIPSEFAAMTVGEARDLVAWFKNEFDIDHAMAEMIVEKSFDTAVALAEIFELLKKS